jgi:hypothetical protein
MNPFPACRDQPGGRPKSRIMAANALLLIGLLAPIAWRP